MNFNYEKYRYPSRRAVVFGTRGMVATGQQLAAQAGLDILKRGGNAVDAAVAAAACLTVVEPVMNGIGGDNFALVWIEAEKKLYGLNSSGFAPALADAELLRGKGEIPALGWPAVTVPGAPAGWAALIDKFGKLRLSDDLAPAIECAEYGFAVSPTVSLLWNRAFDTYSKLPKSPEFTPWFDTFAPSGRAPMPGDVMRAPDHAATLRRIAESNAGDFYCGEIADRIDKFSSETGGWLRKADLESYKPEWVEPISVNYRGFDVWEIPPNGQGITVLMALKIFEGLGAFAARESAELYHAQIEAMKLAFTDSHAFVADSRFMRADVGELLSEEYASQRRALIGREALEPTPGRPRSGGTVYLAAADAEGNMISMIQSNYKGFGSAVVVPGTGIALHNRGLGFSLDPDSPNVLAPGKKPYHTIIPGFLTSGGEAVGPFGVMGGYMQPQGHMQVVSNMVDFAMNPQEALDAPRWQWTGGKKLLLESAVPGAAARELASRGHDVEVTEDSTSFGRGQIIVRTPQGSLAGATEPRTDGCAAAW